MTHIVLAGGGTAGHIEPALSLADALRRHDPACGITALGTTRGLETRLVPERGYELALIPPVPLPRKPSPALLSLPKRANDAVNAVIEVLRRTQADALVGFGGYVSFPAYLAARKAGVPFVVHEANAKPGLANRLGSRFTTYVATAGAGIDLPHAEPIGIPLRRAIATLDRGAVRAEARAAFGLDADLPTLLIFGGSQGARRLNQSGAAAADALCAAGVQVLHASGRNQEVEVPAAAAATGRYHVVPYIDRMDLAYAAADLVVCRAGAITCAELAAVGLPAVYVPLPIGNGEQRLNALPTVHAGGGLLREDAELTGDWLAEQAIGILTQPQRLADMAAAAAGQGRRGADESLVAMVYRAIAERKGE